MRVSISSPLVPVLATLLPLAAGSACSEPEAKTYDPDETIATAVAFEDELERLDLEAFATEHLEGDGLAKIWATPEAAEIFRTLDPMDLEQTAEFPPGTIIVKDNYDLQGNPSNLLNVMAKFEPGYNPAGNDWFFALIERDGTVIGERIGKGGGVEFCRDCHKQNGEKTDLIIALPADNLR